MAYWIYIMGSDYGKAMYIGVTNDLLRRVREHKSDMIDGFTKRYRCHKLLYYEQYPHIMNAIAREKQLKGWNRQKKRMLIEAFNPGFEDLDENNSQFESPDF